MKNLDNHIDILHKLLNNLQEVFGDSNDQTLLFGVEKNMFYKLCAEKISSSPKRKQPIVTILRSIGDVIVALNIKLNEEQKNTLYEICAETQPSKKSPFCKTALIAQIGSIRSHLNLDRFLIVKPNIDEIFNLLQVNEEDRDFINKNYLKIHQCFESQGRAFLPLTEFAAAIYSRYVQNTPFYDTNNEKITLIRIVSSTHTTTPTIKNAYREFENYSLQIPSPKKQKHDNFEIHLTNDEQFTEQSTSSNTATTTPVFNAWKNQGHSSPAQEEPELKVLSIKQMLN